MASMDSIVVKLEGRAAVKPGESFLWTGHVERGTTIAELFTRIAKDERLFSEHIFNKDNDRLSPYHLLFINKQIIRPDKFKTFPLTEPVEMKIIPFVSGG